MRVGIRELRQRLKYYVETARDGEDVIITDHGRPVARLAPMEERTIDRLIREGLAAPPSRHKDEAEDWELVEASGSVSDLIERR